MSEDRLTELEIRFSHQDQFLRELNQVVVEQQIKIERLEKEILDLKRNVISGDIPNEKPPHY